MALQPNGKTVAVGFAGADGPGGGRFAFARYNPDGSPDTSFSGNGRQMTNFAGLGEKANGVALQDDGKIVAVGFAGSGGSGQGDFALARYNPNGSLDPSFSGDGKQRTRFPFGGEAFGVVLQANGKIVAVGGDGNGDFALARYRSRIARHELLRRRQGDDGLRDLRSGERVALQGDGKIVAVGFANDRFFGFFALARYNPNGSLDPSFAGNGKVTTSIDPYANAYGVALQGDGKIVAVGHVGFDGGDFALARYNPNGSLRRELLRRRPADDRLRGRLRGERGGGPGGRQDRRRGRRLLRWRRLRARPLQGQRIADSSFSGDGKQTTDFGGRDGGKRGGAHAARQDRRGSGRALAPSQTHDFALARYLGG